MWGFYNVLINGEKPGSIVFEGSKIFGIYLQEKNHRPPEDVNWVSGHKCEAYPAGIDMHVHDRWGEPEKEDPSHLENAAIAGGIGTMVMMPNTKPPFDRTDQIEHRAVGFSRVNILAWMAATRTNVNERRAAKCFAGHIIPGSKLYMASSTNPDTLVDDEASQTKILEENADIGAITVVHAEAEDWINRNRAEYKKLFNPLTVRQHCAIRESAVEVEGIRRILEIHKNTKGRIHIAHVSTAEGIHLILNAKARGQLITFETCPHYFTLHEDFLNWKNGGEYKMNPALRPAEEQFVVQVHFCNGNVDVCATDHAPHPYEQKIRKGLDECPSGIPGIETNIPLVYQLKQRGRISSQLFIDVTSGNPAKILGLNKGRLEAGFDADVMLIDPSRSRILKDEDIKSKCGWTPFRGQSVNVIAAVVIGGKKVKQDFGLSLV